MSKKSSFTIRLPKQIPKPRTGIQHTKKITPKTVYKRQPKHKDRIK